jgi:monovalent cation:H+ antiporter, CPA1 family
MEALIYHTLLLLAIAILIALTARRLHLPYTVGLVVVGMSLTLMHISMDIPLTHEFIFDVILPPLLFEAALNLQWKDLQRDMLPILWLSTLGVVVSAFFVGCGMTYFLAWPWPSALVFGVLIAATDPVAIIAMFKDTGITGRLRLLVEGESLFNDGVAAVCFGLVLAWAQAAGNGSMDWTQAPQLLALTIGGGIFIGAACGATAVLIAGRTADHLVETALTTIVAYGSFLLAEQVHASGVLATVTAGLLMGNCGALCEEKNTSLLSDKGRAFILDFWEFVAFLANSLIFLLIGLHAAAARYTQLGIGELSIVIALVMMSRAVTVYPLCIVFDRGRLAIPLRYQHVLMWGGLRGALALALALSVPSSLFLHDAIVIATFGVVAFSVIVPGLTMPALLRKLRI